VEQVWRDKKIVSKGWKFSLLPQWNKFGFRSGKHLKPALLFGHSGFGRLENDKRKYEGRW
jgi:hypothetical protein